jgi:YbbR domain-containing protein
VVPALDGRPADGFLVGGISVEPRTVSVAGPETRLRNIRAATTAPVLIDGARSGVSATVDVGVVDGELRLSEAQTARVSVAIVPVSDAVARTFFELPVAARGLADSRNVLLDPLRVSVVIRASPGTVGRVDPVRVAPYVDVVGLGPGSYTLPVHVDPDPTFVVGTISPSTVKVQVR